MSGPQRRILTSVEDVERATALLVVQSDRGETGWLEPWTRWACDVAAARFDFVTDPSGKSQPFADALAAVLTEERTEERYRRGQALRADDMNPLKPGRDRTQLDTQVKTPTLEAIDHGLLSGNPYHPTFLRDALGDVDSRRGFFTRIALVKKAGFDDVGRVLAAMKMTVNANHRRQKGLILPAARGMSRPAPSSSPSVFWRSKLQGEDVLTVNGPRYCALAECWGYDQVARHILKDLAEAVFPAEVAARGSDLFSSLLFVGKPDDPRNERFVPRAVNAGLKNLRQLDLDGAEDHLRAIGIRSPNSLAPVTMDRLTESETPENLERAQALVVDLTFSTGR